MQQHTTWIHNLLDGELSAHDEPSLFGELSVNPDLRHEFKQQLAIRSAVQHDRMALVPPAHLTNTVFSGLGFAAPMAGAAAGAAGGGFLLPWLLKLGLPILSAAAAVGITMAVSDAPNNQNLSQSNSQQSIGAPGANTSAQDASERTLKPGDSERSSVQSTNERPSSQRITERSSNQQISERPSQQQISERSSNGSASNSDTEELAALRRENRRLRGALANAQAETDDETPTRNIAPASADQSEPSVSTATALPTPVISSIELTNHTTFENRQDLRAIEMQIMPTTRQTYTSYPSAMVQARGFASNHLADVSVPRQSIWYENIALGFVYELSPHHAVGVELVGSESFSQRFEGQRNGQIIRYEQRPSTPSWGALYRYTANPLGKLAIQPFGQVLLGATEYGPMGRMTAGIQYNASDPLTFIFGLEYTTLGYKFQDAWFTSNKLGITYGMAVRL